MPSSTANSRRSSRSASSAGWGSRTRSAVMVTDSPSRSTTPRSPESAARRKPATLPSSAATTRSVSQERHASSGHTSASTARGTGRERSNQRSTSAPASASWVCRKDRAASRSSHAAVFLAAGGTEANSLPLLFRATITPSRIASSCPVPVGIHCMRHEVSGASDKTRPGSGRDLVSSARGFVARPVMGFRWVVTTRSCSGPPWSRRPCLVGWIRSWRVGATEPFGNPGAGFSKTFCEGGARCSVSGWTRAMIGARTRFDEVSVLASRMNRSASR